MTLLHIPDLNPDPGENFSFGYNNFLCISIPRENCLPDRELKQEAGDHEFKSWPRIEFFT